MSKILNKVWEVIKKVFSAIGKFLADLYGFAKKCRKNSIERRKMRDEKRGYHINWFKAVRHSFAITVRVIVHALSYIVNIIATILIICLVTGMIVGVVFILYLKTNVNPELDIDVLTTEQNGTTMFYYLDENGNAVEMEQERIHSGDNRIWVSYDEIPKYVKEAFVAIEDHRFWDHKGVDWYRTLGAVQNFFLPSGTTFGGSTITQQLIKNLTQEDDYSIQRKVQEIFRALYLEKQLSKEEILELYLNTIYLSQGCYGIKTAAEEYFGKDVSELTLVEAAAIASITKYPTKYDPIQNPDNNRDRRNTVLKTMLLYGKITQAEFDEAYDAQLDLHEESSENTETPDTKKVSSDYVDAAIEDIIADLMEQKGVTREIASNLLYSGGYKIYLAMDYEVQSIMEKCYLDESNFPVENMIIKPQSAMVVCDPETGDVLGIAGRRGEKSASRVLNYATQTRRSPGSSIKPLSTYAPAIDLGLVTWATVIDDTPVEFYETTTWPKNVSKDYTGLQNIAYAIKVSLNTAAVKTLQMVTIERSYEFLLKLGIHNLEEAYTTSSGIALSDLGLAPLALGATTIGLTVREMASAYTTFLNNGVHAKSRTYYRVVDESNNNEVVLENAPEYIEVFKPDTCAVMIKMMENVVNYRNMKIDSMTAVAGKTGTSMYEYDKWFCGFTPYYVGAVWYGFEQQAVLPTFRTFAPVYIFDNVMTALHKKMYDEATANGTKLIQDFDQTSHLQTALICLDSGLLYDPETCGLDLRGDRSQVAYFVPGTAPTTYCKRHIVVDYCAETNCVACANCQNTYKVALVLETERNFPYQVYVTDAQYMYRPLEDAMPYLSATAPFYQNTIPAESFVGLTYKANPAANAYCSKHYLTPPEPEDTGEDTETGEITTSGE